MLKRSKVSGARVEGLRGTILKARGGREISAEKKEIYRLEKQHITKGDDIEQIYKGIDTSLKRKKIHKRKNSKLQREEDQRLKALEKKPAVFTVFSQLKRHHQEKI